MKKLMIANWKSNKSREDIEKWMDAFEEMIKTDVALEKVQYESVICPPMSSLMFVSNRLLNRMHFPHTHLGVQDISPFSAGSYTGAISGQNLQGFKVKYSIVGHSERRKYFHESSLDVAKKVDQCLDAGITPIICVDRKEIDNQADQIDKHHYKKLVIAYEPVDHIGTGISQEVDQVLSVIDEIRVAFPGARVIYGGSVNEDNIDNFISHDEIEGFLVGTASLDVEHFVRLMKM